MLSLSSLPEADRGGEAGSGKYIHTPSGVVKSDDDNAAVKEADDFALLGRPPLPFLLPLLCLPHTFTFYDITPASSAQSRSVALWPLGIIFVTPAGCIGCHSAAAPPIRKAFI